MPGLIALIRKLWAYVFGRRKNHAPGLLEGHKVNVLMYSYTLLTGAKDFQLFSFSLQQVSCIKLLYNY
jgi:hypothetical protein